MRKPEILALFAIARPGRSPADAGSPSGVGSGLQEADQSHRFCSNDSDAVDPTPCALVLCCTALVSWRQLSGLGHARPFASWLESLRTDSLLSAEKCQAACQRKLNSANSTPMLINRRNARSNSRAVIINYSEPPPASTELRYKHPK